MFVHFYFSCFFSELLMTIMSGFSFQLRIKRMHIIFPRLLYTHCYAVATRPGPRFTRLALFHAPHYDTLRTSAAACVTSTKAGTSSLLSKGPQLSVWDCSRVARGKTAISGTPDHLNECILQCVCTI